MDREYSAAFDDVARSIGLLKREMTDLADDRDALQDALLVLAADAEKEQKRLQRVIDVTNDARTLLEKRAHEAERQVAELRDRVEALKAEPVDLKAAEGRAREIESDLRLARREIKRLERERDILVERLNVEVDGVRAAAEAASGADAHAAHQMRRRLERAEQVNRELSVQAADWKDQAERAEQRARDVERAMLEHSGRT